MRTRYDEITPVLIERFKRERRASISRRGKERAPPSVNRELEALSRIFTLAIEQDVVVANPSRKVKKLLMDNVRTRYLSAEEEEKLIEALNEENQERKREDRADDAEGLRDAEKSL